MTDENDLTYVINRTAHIENLLDQVITKYCAPREEAFYFFWEVMLNNSILPLGAKAKAAMAISQEIGFGLKQDAIHKVVSLRNAFAHQSQESHPTIHIGAAETEDYISYSLYSISNSGKVQKINRQDAMQQFNDNFSSARESLINLMATVKKHVESSA